MNSNIFIPKTLKVGYVNRPDTYTGKLAYIIYIDAQGKVRKEKSWESWRDKKLTPLETDNEPTSGFVLNKKAGGNNSGWNHRQTYCRVYDPRGFEFEISIQNLLYILENTNSIKGKGLEGEFVYGWCGTDLILIPTSSPDYTQLNQFAEEVFNKEIITSKNIILGATYRTDKNSDWVYLGRYDEYMLYDHYGKKAGDSKGKKYFFQTGSTITTTSGLSKLIKTVDPNPVFNYAELMDNLSSNRIYSPYEPKLDVITKVSLKDLENKFLKHPNISSVEVVFTIDGVDLVSNLRSVRKSVFDATTRKYSYTEPTGYYLETPTRRVPLDYSEMELKTVHNHGSRWFYGDNGWDIDYNFHKTDGNLYNQLVHVKRDAQLVKIKEELHKTEYFSNNARAGMSLEKLDKQFKFSLRKKFLANGKPLNK